MPAARSASSVTATGSLALMPGSVTTITRRPPSWRMSCPISRVTPGPYLTLDVSMEKAVSKSMAAAYHRCACRSRGNVPPHSGAGQPCR